MGPDDRVGTASGIDHVRLSVSAELGQKMKVSKDWKITRILFIDEMHGRFINPKRCCRFCEQGEAGKDATISDEP